jgi:hypothetical protein
MDFGKIHVAYLIVLVLLVAAFIVGEATTTVAGKNTAYAMGGFGFGAVVGMMAQAFLA